MNTPRLDVAKVLYGAFVLPWRQRDDFARALALPLALLFALTVSWFYIGSSLAVASYWLLTLLYGILFTLLAVPCHRLILIGPDRSDNPIPNWEWRKTRFLLSMGLLWVCMATVFLAASMVFVTVAGTLLPNILGTAESRHEILDWAVWLAGNLPAYYLLARLSLILPAIATDRKVRIADVWVQGKNNGLRLMLVVCILPWALSSLIDTAYRDNASAFEIGLLTLLGCLSFIIEISALSLAYRELSQER